LVKGFQYQQPQMTDLNIRRKHTLQYLSQNLECRRFLGHYIQKMDFRAITLKRKLYKFAISTYNIELNTYKIV